MLTGYGFDNEFVDFRGRFVSQDGFRIPLEREIMNLLEPLAVPRGRAWIRRAHRRPQRADRSRRARPRARGGRRPRHESHPQPSGGLAGRGLFFDREHDTAGVGYVYSDVQAAPLATGTLLDTAAQRAELYYTFQFGAATELTLDLQWADSLLGTVDEATVLGFRVRTQF